MGVRHGFLYEPASTKWDKKTKEAARIPRTQKHGQVQRMKKGAKRISCKDLAMTDDMEQRRNNAGQHTCSEMMEIAELWKTHGEQREKSKKVAEATTAWNDGNRERGRAKIGVRDTVVM